MYQLTENSDQIIRLDDGASIPRGHRWWGDYEVWIADGNFPQPAFDNRADTARAIRDRMLNDCDWRMKVDSPMDAAQKSAYTDYRKALRDVPQQSGFPTTINWPIEP